MSNAEQPGILKKFNINTVICVVLLAVMSWVGTSVLKLTDEVTRLKTISEMKLDQANRLETEVGRMREQINGIQVDMARIKSQTAK